MILECPIESFDQLFEGPELFRLGIKVLQANHLLMADVGRIQFLRIEEMDASGVSGVTVRNNSDFLVITSSPDSFLHGDNRWQSSPVVGNVIGRDFEAFAGDEEKYVLIFAQHLDVGLIASRDIIYLTFMTEVEAVTVPGSTGSVIEHRLMRDLHTEDISEDSRSLSGRDGKRDIEGQDQAEDILAVMDFGQFDRRFVRR